MTNPFALWSSWLSTGRMLSETVGAAQAVISSRSGTIAEATRNPLGADVAELSLMVTEKTRAFAKAGRTVASDWGKMQHDLLAQAEAMSSLWIGGPPTPAKALAMMARSERINKQALASGVRALRPIHAVATANQRRLAKAR